MPNGTAEAATDGYPAEEKLPASEPGFSDPEANPASEINERALMRKIDANLLPAVGILYLLSFLDRSNVGNARIEGLATDVGMTGDEYLTGLTLFFIGYVLFEIPCNIILKRTSPRQWLPTLTIVWGIVATLLGVVRNLPGFFVARFFLGVAESGLFPGVVYYFSMWYKRRERQFRISLFFSGAALAGAFGGILAYGIGFMKGISWPNGWHWIFILEGLATVLIGVGAYWFIQNYPSTASFLSEREREFVNARLAADSDATHDEGFTWHNVARALKDPKCWLYGLCFHTTSLPLYTYSLFLPTIINELGYSAATAQLMTIPPYAVAFFVTFAAAWYSERLQKRAIFIIASALLGAVGYIILLANTDPVRRPGVSYAGTFIAAAGIYSGVALTLSWPAINVSGQTKRAVANAMQISIGNLGAVMGTQLYRTEYQPRHVVGHSVALAYMIGNAVVTGLLWWMMRRENRRRDAIAEEVKEVGNIDHSTWKGDDDPRWRFQY
ncbi:hypothetical protein VTK73DRAFT_2939 [Phialemonium thermophilum]|uniref:Major facilitator superfamily (MFS) profile domain-containing protein n=1 Tax=Phialemonium thermophilum TaxID=223376 RepID=A0ABR3X1A3_9PEZI